MSKKLISILIVLMSISLLGIVVVQILWIRNAISFEEKTFDSNINKSLHNVVNQLEKKEAVILLSNEFSTNPNVKLKDFDVKKFNTFIDKDIKSKLRKIELHSHIKIKKNTNHTEKSDSQIIVMGNAKNKISIWHPRQIKDTILNIDIEINDKDSIYRTIRKEKQIENIFEKVVYEFKSKDLPLSDRINLHNLPILIAKELKNFDIITDFSCGILSGTPKKIIYQSKSVSENELKYSPYQINLFPNDIVSKQQVLSVSFPNRFSIIHNTILPLLFLSVLFTAFIILTFVIAVFLIIKQKRISDIKSDFINNITHEFKTPIATIGLAADSINNPKIIGLPDKIRYFTGIIKDENFRMNKQVENILQLSLFGKHEIELNLQTCHVHDIIQKATEHIQLQIQDKNGEISTDLNAINDISKIDEVHFLNVLFNLFDNSIKYSRTTTKIEITTENKNNDIIISIKDYGIGMNTKSIKKAFNKFYRAESGNIHNIKGFGLGLSYVKLVIARHQGNIAIKSVLGKSTTVIISIPLSLDS